MNQREKEELAQRLQFARGYLKGVEFCADRASSLCETIKRNRTKGTRDDRVCMDGAIGVLEDLIKAFRAAAAAGRAEFGL